MTNGIVARTIAGAICGAGFLVLFGYMLEGHVTRSSTLLEWFARDPANVKGFGVRGAVIGASLAYLLYLRARNKP
jgi:hypothetical protein